MREQDFQDFIQKKKGISANAADEYVNEFKDLAEEFIIETGCLKLAGLGSWEVVLQEEKTIKVPAGRMIVEKLIPKRFNIKHRISSVFRNKVQDIEVSP